jgi:CBS domain-containing protein
MPATSLGTLVTYNPWSVSPSALLEEIAERFEELRIHHVPVVDGDRHVVGMLSETDLLRARQAQRAVLVGCGAGDTDDAPLVFARDVMSKDVLSVSPTSSAAEALKLLLARQIHALPVMDGGRLVGMISSRDFLREFSYGELDGTRDLVTTLLTATAPESLEPGVTLSEALLAMQAAGVSCLAVAQGTCPLGLVWQRDIVREDCRLDEQEESHHQPRPAATVLRIVRNSPPLRSGQRLREAAAAMIEHGLPAVIVVNQSSRLLGVITEDDLLRVLYDALA